ncbi:MAG: UDP-N-acetylglucosamine pyrophosphorylase, partial [Clostridia bacterium]|nr:UDP-N-acetylglucosamine pyrophosphorylase [Clostridia bacterium]
MKICNFFDLDKSIASRLLLCSEYPWDALDMLGEYILRVGRGLSPCKYEQVRRGVWIARDADACDS